MPETRSRGSSPLARGLLNIRPHVSGRIRIIPARAGFTPRSNRIGRYPGDHPRSRGVYLSPCAAALFMAGSSPLARGLLSFLTPLTANSGIIPARAGFTFDDCVDSFRWDGSSPLARGLLPILFHAPWR